MIGSKDVITAFLLLDTSMFPTIHLPFILISSFPNSIFPSTPPYVLSLFYPPSLLRFSYPLLLLPYIFPFINPSFYPPILNPSSYLSTIHMTFPSSELPYSFPNSIHFYSLLLTSFYSPIYAFIYLPPSLLLLPLLECFMI